MIVPTSSTVYFAFYHPTTGIADGSWTKTLLKNNAVQAQTITITETATNIYTGSFATDTTSDAYWYLRITSSGQGYQQVYFATKDLRVCRKALLNNLDKAGTTVTIENDDGSTWATYKATTLERTLLTGGS